MSRLIRCNRCGLEDEIDQEPPNILGLMKAIRVMPRWSRVMATKVATVTGAQGETKIFDLCEDCVEILVEQFIKGAPVAPITQPLNQVILPHQPMTDCMLVWDPEHGGFLCEHDFPERYHKLCRDQAQNAAEGVPPQKVEDAVDEESVVWHLANRAIIGGHELDGNHLRALDLALSYAADQPQMFAGNEVLKGARSSVHGAILRLLRDGLAVQEAVHQMVEDVETARATGAMPQRCSRECSEQHTYGPGCLLENVVQPPRGMQIIEDEGEESEFPPVPGIDIPPQRGWSGDPDNG